MTVAIVLQIRPDLPPGFSAKIDFARGSTRRHEPLWCAPRMSRRSGYRFSEKDMRNNAPVAQLDRASDFESEGREFESLRARQSYQYVRSAFRIKIFPKNMMG